MRLTLFRLLLLLLLLQVFDRLLLLLVIRRRRQPILIVCSYRSRDHDVVQCHLGQKCFRQINQTKENFNYGWIVDAQRLVTVCPHLKRLSKYRRFPILNISLPLLPLDLPDFWVWCLRGSRFHPESFVMFVRICV
jgi:hypothetical protein